MSTEQHRARPWIIGTTLVMLLVPASCYLFEGPPVYSSDPIRIRVVDEETQTPVAGVVAFAHWEGKQFMGGQRFLHAAEAVSGPDGWLTIPEMKIFRKPMWTMTFQDPLIDLYKPGAYAEGVNNEGAHQFGYASSDPRRAKRIAFWNGKTVPLRRIGPSLTERQAYESLESLMINRVDPTRYPHTWAALLAGYSRLPNKDREDVVPPQLMLLHTGTK